MEIARSSTLLFVNFLIFVGLEECYFAMKKVCLVIGGSLLTILLIWGFVSCNGRKMSVNPPIKKTVLQPIQNINVYLENSGSMDGYVEGNTGF